MSRRERVIRGAMFTVAEGRSQGEVGVRAELRVSASFARGVRAKGLTPSCFVAAGSLPEAGATQISVYRD
eukprot:4445606-Pleurochrysis_carterae.AAC.1